MRETGIDPTALLVVLAAAVLVLVAALGTAPAYSDDAPNDPAAAHRSGQLESPAVQPAGPAPVPDESSAAINDSSRQASHVDTDGYQWSGSRPADERYLWSHRPN